jgi:hypothetical protein
MIGISLHNAVEESSVFGLRINEFLPMLANRLTSTVNGQIWSSIMIALIVV